LRSIVSSNPELAEKIRIEADYFEKNTERMRYPEFRAQHLFVGSGVIEAGCKSVIGSRLKQSGMFWTVRGANAIIALRCCHLNNRFEDYWEARRPVVLKAVVEVAASQGDDGVGSPDRPEHAGLFETRAD